MSARFRTTVQQTGKTAMGFEIPPDAVARLGAGEVDRRAARWPDPMTGRGAPRR